MRNPLPNSLKDDLLLCCIRRVTLDSLWGRESQTVSATLHACHQMVQQLDLVGLDPQFPSLGPYPIGDSFGVRVAVAMVLKSLQPGRYHGDYQQFETIRKLSAAHSNVYLASLEGAGCLRATGGDRTKQFLNLSPTYSLWFGKFKQGCLRRMGQDVCQNWALTVEAMGALMQELEREWSVATRWRDRHLIAAAGAYAVIAFGGSFRGNEVFLTDLCGLRKYLEELRGKDFVMIPLLGRFKGEQHARYHLQPLGATTSLGLQIRVWVTRLVTVMEESGQRRGPAFGDSEGQIMSARVLEEALMERLQAVKDKRPVVIPGDVDCYEDYGRSRSFRRGATSLAQARGVLEKLIDLINRWRKFEGAKGRRPAMAMQDHYSDIEIMIPELVKFSSSL
jgi:hypothetical protein